jgi:hypothetical protein
MSYEQEIMAAAIARLYDSDALSYGEAINALVRETIMSRTEAVMFLRPDRIQGGLFSFEDWPFGGPDTIGLN